MPVGHACLAQPLVLISIGQVEHWGNDLYIITNADGCINSKLVKTPVCVHFDM